MFSGGTLPDLAVANQNDNTISILLNQDNGNFVAQANSPFVLAANEIGPVAHALPAYLAIPYELRRRDGRAAWIW